MKNSSINHLYMITLATLIKIMIVLKTHKKCRNTSKLQWPYYIYIIQSRLGDLT